MKFLSATIAVIYAKALEENLDSYILSIKTRPGTLPFEIIKTSSDYKSVKIQSAIKIDPPFTDEHRSKLLTALGITENDLLENYPIQIASTGYLKGIKSKKVLTGLSPNFCELESLNKLKGCNGYFVFTFDAGEDVLTQRGMFAPGTKPEVGQQYNVTQQDGNVVTVSFAGIDENNVSLDANHPLAGKKLIFEVEVVEIG